MSIVLTIRNLSDLDFVSIDGVDECLIGVSFLSRNISNTLDEFYEFSHQLKAKNKKRVLCFDALVCERDFKRYVDFFHQIDPKSYEVVRVQDLGVFYYLIQEGFRVQLILETSFHNLESVKTILDDYSNSIEKLIFSYELTKELLAQFIDLANSFNVKSESLAYGPILLFYSPRNLLTAADIQEKQVIADSLESAHKGFEVVENHHGTFMYHLKDLDIFSNLADLEIDKRVDPFLNIDGLEIFFNSDKSDSTRKTTRGYFSVNKSDVLFPKLKNSRLNRKDKNFVGTVLENKKGSYTAIRIEKNDVKVGDELRFINPEGKIIDHKILKLYDLSFEHILKAGKSDIFLLDSIKKLTPKTKVYLSQ